MRFYFYRRLSFFSLAAFVLVVFSSAKAEALTIPPKPEAYVNDYAQVLSPQVVGEIDNTLRAFESRTSNQIVVAIFPSLDGEALEDISIRIAEAWKVGQKGKDNGVLLLIFFAEHELRIEVGYGLEGALTDGESGIIIREVIVPYFRQNDFGGGVRAGVAAIMQATEGEFEAPPPATETPVSHVLFAIVLFLFLLDSLRYISYRSTRLYYKERYRFWEWFFRFAILVALLKAFFQGGGGRRRYYSSGSGGSSSGGFSSGGFSSGGGGFGGGGASGKW